MVVLSGATRRLWIRLVAGGAAIAAIGLLVAYWRGQSGEAVKKLARESKQLQNEFDNSYIAFNTELKGFDEKGQLIWNVKAKKATYSKDQKVAQVEEPSGELFQDGKAIMKVSAKVGEVQQDGKKIFLRGDIQAKDLRDGLEIKGNELEWQPKNNIILVRNKVVGTQKQLNVTANAGKYLTRDRRVELEGGVTAMTTGDQPFHFKSDRLFWELKNEMIRTDRPIQVDRFKDKKNPVPSDRAVAQQGSANLKTEVITLNQSAQVVFSDPPMQVSSNNINWSLKDKEVSADQRVTFVNQKEQLVLMSDRGRLNLATNVANLLGNVQGEGGKNQARLTAETLMMNLTTRDFEATGNVTYRQTNPVFNLSGPQAKGRLQEAAVISGGEAGGRVVTEIVPP